MKLTRKQQAKVKDIDGESLIPLSALEFHWSWDRAKEEILEVAKELVIAGKTPADAVNTADELIDVFFNQIVKNPYK